jgi:hypothetical protein
MTKPDRRVLFCRKIITLNIFHHRIIRRIEAGKVDQRFGIAKE